MYVTSGVDGIMARVGFLLPQHTRAGIGIQPSMMDSREVF